MIEKEFSRKKVKKKPLRGGSAVTRDENNV